MPGRLEIGRKSPVHTFCDIPNLLALIEPLREI